MGEGRDTPRQRKVPRTPDAVDFALDGVSDDVARTLLEKHGHLIDAQIKSERLDHGAKRTLIAVRLLIGLVGLIIAGALVWMIADARADHGLVIEALSVPPDLAQRGLTGEALAANLSDRLADIDRKAQSFRSPETLQVNWGNDIKIEIPSTGVSIDELDRYLHRKLGSETIIGGAVFREPAGLRLTVRTGTLGTIEQTGTDANLEAMIQKAAEGVFQQTQAYRYSKYLEFSGRMDEAMAVARQLAATSDDPKERAWAWAQISNLLETVDMRQAAAAGYRAIQEDPDNALAYLNTCIAINHLSSLTDPSAICRKAAVLGAQTEGGLSAVGVNTSRGNLAGQPANTGDFAESLRQLQKTHGQEYAGVQELSRAQVSTLLTSMHDVSGSRRVGGTPSDAYLAAHFANAGGLSTPEVDQAVALEDWPKAVALLQQVLAVADTEPEGAEVATLERERAILPRLAIYMALDGQIGQARAIVAGLPNDCFSCLSARAAVSALAGDIPAAKRLLVKLDAARPNLPFPDATFATILFRRGDNQEALTFADRAISKGPKFPDALKVRGDALRNLNRLDDAADSYAKAAQGAPRWGRLQIDWGFAEMRRGRWADARKHLAAAGTMDLNAADRRLLTKLQQIASTR